MSLAMAQQQAKNLVKVIVQKVLLTQFHVYITDYPGLKIV
jgi:hypothetical protein